MSKTKKEILGAHISNIELNRLIDEAREGYVKIDDLRNIFNKLDKNGHEHADKWLKLENWIIDLAGDKLNGKI